MLALGGLCFADTITLKNGGVIQGTYLGGDARHVKIATGDRMDTYRWMSSNIRFGGTAAPPPPPPANSYTPGPDGLERRTDAPPPDRLPTSACLPTGIPIPAGTALVVRMIDPVGFPKGPVGQTYRASIDEPVVVDGQTMIPRGADVIAKLVEDQQSGKIEGRTVLTLDLPQVQVNSGMMDVNTEDVASKAAPVARGAPK